MTYHILFILGPILCFFISFFWLKRVEHYISPEERRRKQKIIQSALFEMVLEHYEGRV